MVWHLEQGATCPLASPECAGGFVLRVSQFVESGAAFSIALLLPPPPLLLPPPSGLRIVRHVRIAHDGGNGTSSDEENEEHNVGNLSLEVVVQGGSGMLIDGFSRGLGACAGGGELS